MKTDPIVVVRVVFALAAGGAQFNATAQGTAFTYQGRLIDGGSPAQGIYDFRFAIYNAQTNGAQVGGSLTSTAVGVTNGLFTAMLDFGAGIFTGPARWLDIDVRTNGGVFTNLAPRAALTPVPYAMYAGQSSTVTNGAISASQLQTSGAPSTGQVLAFSGTSLVWQTPSATNAAWGLTGNAGTAPANFLGTTDPQPLLLKANGVRLFKLDPNPGAPNILGGAPGNFISAGVEGATLAGGGTLGTLGGAYTNTIRASYSTIGGGLGNLIASNAYESTIAGGNQNTVESNDATVGGGLGNHARGSSSTVSGGYGNTASGGSATAGGGSSNKADADGSAVGGGSGNVVPTNATFATIAGGQYNRASASSSTVGGGYNNTASGGSAVIAGGANSQAAGAASTVGGGQNNNASGFAAAVGGGSYNTASAFFDAGFAIYGQATIGGGIGNSASGPFSTIGGGNNNTASGESATVPGGWVNSANGVGSFAAGHNAHADHNATFVWSSGPGAFNSGGPYRFEVAASGGVNFYTPALTVDGSTSTKCLTINGGCDVAEPFQMSTLEVPKGAVVVIDDENPGKLKLSDRPYDRRVAGIVSGANGINSGIALHQDGVVEGGQNVALSGRVYVQADASSSPIKPGDLLTTSDTPGHAMKVTDHAKAQGAIIGKAMSALKEGKGMVLVLVSLQ